MIHSIYKNKKVFITGHTGFKGSWLSCWLQYLGAEVTGYSLKPEQLSHYNLLKLDLKSYYQNINDELALNKAMSEAKPDIIFHLAAQPLVRNSFEDPIETYNTNLLGTLKVYSAALRNGVPAIVSITTDKVYENKEWIWGYREPDELGGFDPYSSSKACVEIMSSSFRRSFLKNNKFLLATARAGNVIGGGDWAKDRLIPDLIRNAASGGIASIRNPGSIRPWQHVIEPLNGYLLLGEKLLMEKQDYCTSFNFGPYIHDTRKVEEVCRMAKKYWQSVEVKFIDENNKRHEAGVLKLDSTKAYEELGWKPLLNCEQAISLTIDWYKEYYETGKILTEKNIKEFMSILE